MNEWYGLGIALQYKDDMTEGLKRAQSTFDQFKESVQQGVNDIDASISYLNKMQVTGLLMQDAGNTIQNIGASMLNPIVDLGKAVVNTSAQFEDWQSTLVALYKESDLASQKLQWALNLASQTPFQVDDVVQALIGFKAVGVEADQTFTNANGKAKTFLEYMGDLASLRPDVGMQGILIGVRNLLGGDGGKSLKMRMDIDLSQFTDEGKWADTTEGIVKQLTQASDRLANGLMGKLKGNWNQIVSNMEDQATRLTKSIGDNGAFDTFKNSLRSISSVIEGIDDSRMKKIGTNIANAFNTIYKPIGLVVKGLSKVFEWVIKLAESNSIFSKIVLGVLAFSGSILVGTGAVLKFGGGIIQTVASLGTFFLMLRSSPIQFTGLLTSLKTVLTKFGAVGLALGGLYLLWKHDFGGMRTHLTNFVRTVKNAWTDSSKISRLGSTDMINALRRVNTEDFGGWLTYRLVQLKVLWTGLCDAWSDNTLSDENFKKLEALGLIPLISKILDLKAKAEAFFRGFSKGWNWVSDKVKKAVGKIGETLNNIIHYFFPVKKGTDDINHATDRLHLDKWETFGKLVGILTAKFVVGKIASIILGIVKPMVKLAKATLNVASAIRKITVGIFHKLRSAVSSVVNVVQKARSGFTRLRSSINSLKTATVNKVKSAISSLTGKVNSAKASFSRLKTGISSIKASAITKVRGVVNSLSKSVQRAKTNFGRLKTSISSIKATAINKVTRALRSMRSGLSLAVTKMKAGVLWMKNLATSAVFLRAKTIALNVAQKAMNVTQSLWNTLCAVNPMTWIIAGIVGVIAVLVILWNKSEGFREVVGKIINWIGEKVTWIKDNIIAPVINWIVENVGPAFSVAFETAKSVVSSVADSIKGIIDGVKQVIGGIIDFVSGVFSGNWEKAWNGIKDIFSGIWKTVKSIALSPINAIISGLNVLIRGANKISFDVPDWVPGIGGKKFGFNIPEIPKLNTGGFIKDEGISMLHPNEVVINDELTRKLRQFLDNNDSLVKGNSLISKVVTTKNNNSTVNNNSNSNENIDVNFEEGAIKVILQNGTEKDAVDLAKKVMAMIKKEAKLRKTLNYEF